MVRNKTHQLQAKNCCIDQRVSQVDINVFFVWSFSWALARVAKHNEFSALEISKKEYCQYPQLLWNGKRMITGNAAATSSTSKLTVEEVLDYRTFGRSKAKPYWKPDWDFLMKQEGKRKLEIDIPSW